MSKLDFEVVTPERRVVHEQVDEVVLPSLEGYLGVLPGHAPPSPGETASVPVAAVAVCCCQRRWR